MTKRIWILNHYAVPPSMYGEKRHYHLAAALAKRGYDPLVFSSGTLHKTNEDVIGGDREFRVDVGSGVPFAFVRTRPYEGNGAARILGMFDYYRGVMKCSERFDAPDIVYASTPHPLACKAAEKLAARYDAQFVCEVRDFWPESCVDYGMISSGNPVLPLFYRFEKNMYRRADRLVFTMPKGVDYLFDKGWESEVDPGKCVVVANGIDGEAFDRQSRNLMFDSELFADENLFKMVYCGTISDTHPLFPTIKAVERLEQAGRSLHLFVFGSGDQEEELKEYCRSHGVRSVSFEGRVDPEWIPGLVARADLNIAAIKNGTVMRYGPSWLKLAEYLFAGRPFFVTDDIPCNPVVEYDCGVHGDGTTESAERAISFMMDAGDGEVRRMCGNARKAAALFDYSHLAEKLDAALSDPAFALRQSPDGVRPSGR